MATGWARYAFRFGEYYQQMTTQSMWVPPRLKTREWMMAGFDARPPERHRGFRTADELLRYVRQKIPKAAYYSTAYYRDPNVRSMTDKGWRGADLIFDLDGDHLPGVTDRDFPGMMKVIHEQAWTLWNDFLEPEFGFDAKHLHITFSGHRGFHLHYRAPEVLHLDGDARRELVSYIKGDSVDVSTVLRGPDSSWKKRLTGGVSSVLQRLDDAVGDGPEARRSLRGLKELIDARIKSPDCLVKSCGPARLQKLADLAQHQVRRERLERELAAGDMPKVFGKELDPIFIELVKGDSGVVLGNAGETDEAVTLDVKRVIRWPTSLHGKCGLRVTTFPLDRLDPEGPNPFRPFQEAVPWSMKGREHRVSAIVDDAVYEVGEESGELSTGDVLDCSEALAMFLVLKGWAEPVQ